MQPMQIVVEVLNSIEAHNLDKAAHRFADTAVVEDTSTAQRLGKNDFIEQMRSIFAAFPDWHYDLDSIEAEGDEVKVQVTALATQTAPLKLANQTIPATGKHVSVPDQFVFTVIDNEIRSLKIESPKDGGAAAMLSQLGVAAK